jgi:hypothetical protein
VTIYILLAIITVLSALTHKKKARPFLIFVFAAILFQILTKYISAEQHYIIGAIMDLWVIVMLSTLNRINKHVVFLALISLFSIVANFFGWFLFKSSISPAIYNSTFVAIYIAVAIVAWGNWFNNARVFRDIANDCRIFSNRIKRGAFRLGYLCKRI